MHQAGTWSGVCVGFLLLAACVALPGCRSTGNASAPAAAGPAGAAGPAAPADISGTYTLVSINGVALPYPMTHEAPGMRVTAGTLEIDPDGTCSSAVSFVLQSGDSMSRTVNATWTYGGAQVILSWEDAGTTIGTVEGDTFTMENEGQLFAYRRLR